MNDATRDRIRRRGYHMKTCPEGPALNGSYYGRTRDRLPGYLRWDCPCGWFQWRDLTEPFRT